MLLTTPAHALVSDDEPFDPRWIPLELQAWWTPNFGHIHAGTRLPLGQVVSGMLHFDVRIVLHDNPSHLFKLRFDNENGGLVHSISLNLDCPYNGTTSTNCAFNVPVSLDTAKLGEGWHTLRIRATTLTPDGQHFLTSSEVPLNVQNGGSDNNYSGHIWCDGRSLMGKGWYDGFDYSNSIIECVPLTPISGVHTFRVRGHKGTGHLQVALDKSHFIPAVGPWPEQHPSTGQILFDKDGSFQEFFPITIDTTTLADGWHMFQVTSTHPNSGTSQCSYCKGERNHLQGVTKIWFYVQNGQSTPTVATPTITPNGGTFSEPVEVTLATTTASATIRYTTNGSNPTASSPLYSGPFTLLSNATVKARAFRSGYNDSAVASASFTFTDTPTNQIPVVNAGPDQTVELGTAAVLNGTVTDDGLPGPVTTTWSKLSGPGTVTFANSAAVDTTASFSQSGTYELLLTADDGELEAFDEVTITVTPASDPGGEGEAVAHEETKTGGSTGATTVKTAANLTGVSGHLYLAAIATRPPVNVSAVSGLGLTWTPVDTQCAGRNQTGVTVWMAMGVPTGNGPVTATLAKSATNAAIAVSRYSGVNPVTPIGNVVSANTKGVNGSCSGGSDSSAYTVNLPVTVSGAVAYGAAAMRSKTHTPGAGYTELAEVLQGSGGDTAGLAVEEQDVTSPATVAVKGSFSGSVDWAVVTVEIKP